MTHDDPRKGWDEPRDENLARIEFSAEGWTTFPVIVGRSGRISKINLKDAIGDPFFDVEDKS